MCFFLAKKRVNFRQVRIDRQPHKALMQAEIYQSNFAACIFMNSLTIELDRSRGANLKSRRDELELECSEKDR